jgi:two-component system repressor protein LuxO
MRQRSILVHGFRTFIPKLPSAAQAHHSAMKPALPSQMPEVLVIESDRILADLVAPEVWRQSFKITFVQSKIDVLMALRNRKIALLLINLPEAETTEFLHRIRILAPQAQVLALCHTASHAGNMASNLVKPLLHPVDPKWLFKTVQDALFTAEVRTPVPENETVPRALPSNGLIGSCAAIKRVHQLINAVAKSTATVFLTGEFGSGKALTAKAIHAASTRAKGPFITLNCAAISEAAIESEIFGHAKGAFAGAQSDKVGAAISADGGTLFLNNICDLAASGQGKLSAFLKSFSVTAQGSSKSRNVDVRIICASSCPPDDAVRSGLLREDLFYSLYVVPMQLPPLRDRGGDVIEIAQSALERYASAEGRQFDGFDEEVLRRLTTYSWPGNVQELLNAMHAVAVLNQGGTVTLSMLPKVLQEVRHGAKPKATPPHPSLWEPDLADLSLAQSERLVIEAALERHGGSVPKAARVLEISPSTLYRKVEAWKRN